MELLDPGARAFAEVAAASEDPVLLYGETGAGKTCLARLIHQPSGRPQRPFVHVNCAAIPEPLFDREMFGHVRGAFTDARESRPGLVEAAAGGTLFLDEIGELPLAVQPKLLLVLEEGTVRRLGSTENRRAEFRLIAATNRDVAVLLREGRLREDVYYRCAVLEYRIPPLRERRRELPGIIERFIARHSAGRTSRELAPAAREILCAYAWPGNLRELDNCIRRALAYPGSTIEPEHLPERIRQRAPPVTDARAPAVRVPHVYVAPPDADEEACMIREALHAEGGNRTRAARRLGMSRSTLWIKLQRHAGRLNGAG